MKSTLLVFLNMLVMSALSDLIVMPLISPLLALIVTRVINTLLVLIVYAYNKSALSFDCYASDKHGLRACLHGVGDPGLVGLVSFVFTLWRTQDKLKLPY